MDNFDVPPGKDYALERSELENRRLQKRFDDLNVAYDEKCRDNHALRKELERLKTAMRKEPGGVETLIRQKAILALTDTVSDLISACTSLGVHVRELDREGDREYD